MLAIRNKNSLKSILSNISRGIETPRNEAWDRARRRHGATGQFIIRGAHPVVDPSHSSLPPADWTAI